MRGCGMQSKRRLGRLRSAGAAGFAAGLLLLLPQLPVAAGEPLPSWREGGAREEILNFVARVTNEASEDFLPSRERIAVFDHDGTLWAEKPLPFQFFFALDDLRRRAADHPDWQEKEPYKSLLSGDLESLGEEAEKAIAQMMAETHAGMTTEAFSRTVGAWIGSAQHPQREVPYTDLVYQPQLELLDHLQAHGFTAFIVSGGGAGFMRVFAEETYGIPPHRVVGSYGRVSYAQDAQGAPVLLKEPEMEFVDDGAGKAVGIDRFIGQRPVIAVGNSDGDLEMLEYTAAGEGPRLAVLIHHDDGEREYAYARADRLARLDRGLDKAAAEGWTIVSMKRDWLRIFRSKE